MVDEREKLVFLLDEANSEATNASLEDNSISYADELAIMAKHLIANGVSVQKRGRWIKRGIAPNNFYECSYCCVIGSPAWRCCPVCTTRMDLGD